MAKRKIEHKEFFRNQIQQKEKELWEERMKVDLEA